MALILALIAATFLVAFYLFVFGLPIALLLGDRIRHPLALAVALVDAVLAAAIATGGSWLGVFEADKLLSPAFGVVLAFALPAGFLYRRNVITMREVSAFC